MAKLYSQPAHLVVRRGTDIEAITDLVGKRVAIGLIPSGDHAMSLLLLAHFGLSEENIEAESIGYEAIRQRFAKDELDAAIMTVGVQAPVFQELFADGKCELLSIPDANALSNKINAKLLRQRLDRGIEQLARAIERRKNR